nr:type III pantothenate kinase [Oceanococcus sp. HetDA_MAG_MS8]
MRAWLLDAGNTRLKASHWSGQGDIGDVEVVDYAQLSAWAERLAPGERVVISSVASPDRERQLRRVLPPHTQWVRTPKEGLGIRCAYSDHRKWGVDRWLALAAAYAQQGDACGVISIGTAMTFDLCDAGGQHLGGWIAPGPQALLEALGPRTALPPPADLEQGIRDLATDTEPALLSGAMQCALGAIQRAQAQAQPHPIWLTGGGSTFLAQLMEPSSGLNAAPNLVLLGLSAWVRHQNDEYGGIDPRPATP